MSHISTYLTLRQYFSKHFIMKINRVTPDKHNYLRNLTNIAKVPQYVYFTGTLPPDQTTSVAIVRTRKPTTYGKEVANTLSYDLAKKGVVIVSGLALGINAIATRQQSKQTEQPLQSSQTASIKSIRELIRISRTRLSPAAGQSSANTNRQPMQEIFSSWRETVSSVDSPTQSS